MEDTLRHNVIQEVHGMVVAMVRDHVNSINANFHNKVLNLEDKAMEHEKTIGELVMKIEFATGKLEMLNLEMQHVKLRLGLLHPISSEPAGETGRGVSHSKKSKMM